MNSEDLRLDKTPLKFGKHKGKTPDEVSEIDPGWIVWAFKNVKWPVCSQFLYDACNGTPRNHPMSDQEDQEDELDPNEDLGEFEDDIPF